MRYLGIRQLGFLLGAAGASLMLAGAAHADSVSPAQSNQSSVSTNVTVSGQPQTTTTINQTSDTSGGGQSGSVLAPAGSEQKTPSSDNPAEKPAVSSDNPAGPAEAAAAQNPAPADVILAPSATASDRASDFFAPVTIVRALVPQMSAAPAGPLAIPQVKPAPAGPQVPGAPTGALSSASLILGQFTVPLFGWLGHFLHAAAAGLVPYLPILLFAGPLLVMSYAILLRRWGYAISARGSDPRPRLAYEFASPAISELVPV